MIKINTLLAQGVNKETDGNTFSLVNIFHIISKKELNEKNIYAHMNVKIEQKFAEKDFQIGIDLVTYRNEKRMIKELFSIAINLEDKEEYIEQQSINPYFKEINIIQPINEVKELEEGKYDLISYKKENEKKRILDVKRFIIT